MSSEVEYWKDRALIAESAADKLGVVVGQMLPYVNIEGTQAYQTYERWLQWKDRRLDADRAIVKQSETIAPQGQEEPHCE